MARKVTIQDISREAGTSPSTVSRVLTGSAPVSDAKRDAVLQAIERLNYHPSSIARSLRSKVTYSVGLLLNDISNPFYGVVARGIEDEANRAGYSLILCNTNEDPAREQQYLQVLRSKQVDGIILGPTGDNIDFIRELSEQIPIVLTDRALPGCDHLSAVLVDNEAGSCRAVTQLIENGHKRIAMVRWQKQVATMAQRTAGYEWALREHHIALDPALMIDVPALSVESTAAVMQQMFADGVDFTAIFALNNQLGLGVLSAIQASALRIPDDVALVVFDDSPMFSLFSPPITAIEQPAFAIGEQAMRLLLKQMQDPEHYQPETVVLRTRLVKRESV